MSGHQTCFNKAISELPLASFSKRVLVFIPSYDCNLSFTRKLNSFSYKWLKTRPRFEKEAKGNSELSYWTGRHNLTHFINLTIIVDDLLLSVVITCAVCDLNRLLGIKATQDKRLRTWLVNWRLKKSESILKIIWGINSICQISITRLVSNFHTFPSGDHSYINN